MARAWTAVTHLRHPEPGREVHDASPSDLLEARAFNQGYDLNDPSTPDHIYERFNQAYLAAGSPNGPLNAGATARHMMCV